MSHHGAGPTSADRSPAHGASDSSDRPAPPPPPGPNATAREKETYWYRHVYQGDRMPQLTLRAVLMGGVLGTLMSISNLYTTLEVGWAFGIAITACVLSFTIWNGLRIITRHRLTPMSILENNCMQSTASAAGYSTGTTLGTAFGALLLINGEHVPWYALLPFIFFTAAMGTFIAIPMKRQMINIEQLPFPSGMAAAETLRSLYSKGAEALHKAYALLIALGAGLIIGLLKFSEGLLGWLDRFHQMFFRLPDLIPFSSRLANIPRGTMEGFGFEPSGLLIGAGMLVGLRVSLSMLLGSVLLYFVFAPWLLGINEAFGSVPTFRVDPVTGDFSPRRWALWGGTALMVFASLTSLVMDWRTFARAFSVLRRTKDREADELSAIEVPHSWLIGGLIPLAIGTVLVQYYAFGISILLGSIAVLMSFVIALVCCRATGETDTTPIGPMGKVTQLMYAVLARGDRTVNLMSAGATGGAGMPAADLLTDLKSGYLLGANPRKQFIAQFIGVFFGTAAVVPAWYLMVPDKAALERFKLPATQMWKAFAEALTQGWDSIPVTAQYAIYIGAGLGVALQVLTKLLPKAAPYLPSAMGLGLSWALPFQNSLSFAIGAVIAWSWCRFAKRSGEKLSVPIAAGLIAGESMMMAMLAIIAALPAALKTIMGP
ncbi:MAG: OPT/YSL family transporter [Phycisphaerae bacterium]|nr:OPT/YSL family transporter [Phycisphaerae bacterium]NUQ45480.1 OPT/YSL family transporter [Phycisphaerae bacterium]